MATIKLSDLKPAYPAQLYLKVERADELRFRRWAEDRLGMILLKRWDQPSYTVFKLVVFYNDSHNLVLTSWGDEIANAKELMNRKVKAR